MKKLKVAILDDGIQEDMIEEIKFIKEISFINKIKPINLESSKLIPTHGTIVTAIICTYFNMFDLYSIKVINENGSGDISDLVSGLSWCEKNEVDIIHLSLGSKDENDIEKLYEITKKIYDKGKIIIAASSNDDIITYPASFNHVIGVKSNEDFRVIKNSILGLNCYCSGIHRVILNEYGILITKDSNSYAAPYITAQILQIMKEGNSNLELILSKLLEGLTVELIDYDCSNKLEVLRTCNDFDIPLIIFVGSNIQYKKVCDYFNNVGYHVVKISDRADVISIIDYKIKNTVSYKYINKVIRALNGEICLALLNDYKNISNIPDEVIFVPELLQTKEIIKMILNKYI